MQRHKRKYRSAIWVVDVIGFTGVFLLIAGFVVGAPLLPEFVVSFFQNFGVEILGAWISVRLLEWVIRKREEAESARTRVLRHTRFWIHQIRPLKGL